MKNGTNGLGSVYQRGGVWWIAYYYAGELHRESSRSPREFDARALLKRRQRAMAKGRPTPNVEQVTLKKLLDDLRDVYVTNKLASLRTFPSHRTALLAAFGVGARAVDITTSAIRKAIKGWQEAGKANATINRYTTTLRRAFSLAAQAEEFPSIPYVPRLKEENTREGFYTRAEFLAILEHIRDGALRDFIEWGYFTGMRKGEIAKLTRALVDRETWTMTLPGRITKNGKPKTLALVGPLRAIVERRLAAARPDCPLLFWRLRTGGARSGGEPVRIYDFKRAWRAACRRAGLQGRLFHDFRRTGARNLVRAGVDRKVAMAITGHRTESVFSRYNITDGLDLAEAAEKLVAYVETLPTEPTIRPLRRHAEAT